jgi:integrase
MTDPMPRPLPPHVQVERSRHGKVKFYFRKARGGPRIRLPDITDKAFKAAYAKALSGAFTPAPKAHAGTLAWLIESYKASAHWATLKPSTRRMRDNILKRVAAENSTVPFAAITRKHINEAIDRRPPHAGNTFRKVMSQLFKWAQSIDLVEANPVDGASHHRIASDGHHTWTVAEVERFWARWPIGTRERLACDLALFTGLRRGDLALVGRQHVRDGLISIRTEKTGAWVHVPIFSLLQASIDATPGADMAFLATASGKPFSSAASLGNWFAAACRAAKVPGRFHGLRKAGATLAADNGATAHQLMAMYGWSNLKQAELYTRAAERQRLSAIAAGQIENAFVPHPAPGAGQKAKSPKKISHLKK